ncbi:uncharacterized protein LOC132257385 [Phlebotomus argentipes]|uniref:uncharacterized protein LOC132257385 n=1 Tax=Phlebotomus argentipes TaxID=94469 RepID=UPI002893618B|nr:uncharacterized protein LOC132257385 [Phlebotomus argentipes]
MGGPQIVLCCFLIAATSASSVARQSASSDLHEIHPLLRIRRQSGGLCVPEGGYCTKQYHCCSGVCLTFSYKCGSQPTGGTQIDLVSSIIDSTSSFGGSDLENRFGDNDTSAAPVCAQNGEYCQTSHQCCSQRCLSFSYKCVPNYDVVAPSIPGQPSLNPGSNIPQNTMTIEELISNRFGDPDKTTKAPTCLTNGAECRESSTCCSQYCAQATLHSRRCLQKPNNIRPQQPSGLPPRGPGSDTDDGDDSGEGTCIAVGDKCYMNDECCSRRCHGFLHQCVT